MNIEETLAELDPLLRLIARERVGAQVWLLDDAIQEARIRAWQRLEQGHPKGIAVFAARQAVIGVCRGNARMTGSEQRNVPITRTVPLVLESDSGEEYLIEPADPSAEKAYDEVASDDAIESVLSILSPKHREVAEGLADGLTTREIGDKLGLSHQGVTYRVKKIREILAS